MLIVVFMIVSFSNTKKNGNRNTYNNNDLYYYNAIILKFDQGNYFPLFT